MSKTYSNSMIEYCRVAMGAMFGSALENELIEKNPVTKSVRCKMGKPWSDVDFRNRILHVRRTMEYRHCFGEWRIGEPKTKTSIRDIPLTQEALQILKDQRKKIKRMKVISVDFPKQVFLCKDGTPTKNTAYDTKLYYYCDKIGMEHFSMHALRHTFATRCIEAGMRQKNYR